MGGQVALAVVLLVAAALLARSFQELRAADPGFDAQGGLLVRLVLPVAAYPDREQAAAFHERLLERLRGLPGVRSAAVTTCPPLASYCFGDPVSRPGRPWTEGAIPPVASFRRVSDAWFETAGTSLVRGRLLEVGDQRGATRAVVVDERMAELYFPGEDPLGQRILTSAPDPEEDARRLSGLPAEGDSYEIVGVVEHVVVFAVASTDRPPEVYLPLLSHTTNNSPTLHSAAYLLRADGDPLALADGFRAALAELDPAVPAAEVTTLESLLAQDRAPMAFTMALILIAGAVALALGLIGIYGVVSFVVAQRRGEIGVRLALGGRPGDVAGMILWQGARVAGLGMAVGLVAAVAGSRVLTSLLYGVSPTDPRVYAAVTVLLLGVTLLACWLPARRASALDPAHALRAE
jgi:predicted permease